MMLDSPLARKARAQASEHPYLLAAAGGALIAAIGGFLAVRQRIQLERLSRATDEDVVEQIKTGAIAY